MKSFTIITQPPTDNSNSYWHTIPHWLAQTYWLIQASVWRSVFCSNGMMSWLNSLRPPRRNARWNMTLGGSRRQSSARLDRTSILPLVTGLHKNHIAIIIGTKCSNSCFCNCYIETKFKNYLLNTFCDENLLKHFRFHCSDKRSLKHDKVIFAINVQNRAATFQYPRR